MKWEKTRDGEGREGANNLVGAELGIKL